MKNAALPAIVCVFILALGAGVLAGPMQAERPYAEGRRFIGTVVAADCGAGTLVVRNWRGETVFDVSTARFPGHGSLQGLEPGERVVIRYVDGSGRKTATSVIEAACKQEEDGKAGAGVTEKKCGGPPGNPHL